MEKAHFWLTISRGADKISMKPVSAGLHTQPGTCRICAISDVFHEAGEGIAGVGRERSWPGFMIHR